MWYGFFRWSKRVIDTLFVKSDKAQELFSELSSNVNSDYKIKTREFNKEVILLVNQLASLNNSTSEYNEVIRKLDAISYLKNYLQQLTEAGSAAERNIREAHYLLNSDEE